ncbi:MAG: Tex family protein [Pseudomonadales bacterium]|nr:Tex family protein [Pseudomonadales bacterium]
MPPIEARLAIELGVAERQVSAAIGLFDEGATVPFVARYRKEVTGGLDDTQLRRLEERLGYLRELEDRRAAVIASVEEQGRLTPELEKALRSAETRQRLEDLYLPYRPKRRTKAQIAMEAGLDVLAERLLGDPTLDPKAEAEGFLKPAFTTEAGDENPGVPDVTAALEGARAVLMECFAEDADLVGRLRARLAAEGVLRVRVAEGKETEGAKFRDWFEHDEAIAAVPSHRALAFLRGRKEGVLRFDLRLPAEIEAEAREDFGPSPCESTIATHFAIEDRGRPSDRFLLDAVRFAWRVKLQWQLETELVTELRQRAETEAIAVFGRNLEDLLLAAPAGAKCTMGLDPGIRTGVKVAVVDATGKLVDTATIYPFQPRKDRAGSLATLAALVKRHGVELVAIGNGTASRETEQLVEELRRGLEGVRLEKLVVSEAGASVYSASELAAREFPELDVSLRGAVSIARRLQDPLAELVKIEPKAIGVGQYQHDVSQVQLARTLDGVVEDCVNRVGVDLNTASAPLLARVAGVGPTLADAIVARRDREGPFRTRAEVLDVPRLGPKTFEQAAGFLRITGGEEPLDASAVHPEAYPVARRILEDLGADARPGALAGRLGGIDAQRYTDERFGLPTVQDILAELEKPGRDPRPEFVTASFADGVEKLEDLQPGMTLEGVVSNVTNFGAFVDVGVHQDGLVHISQLADRFVKDPRDVVRAGQVVKVRVVEVDLERRRIALSMRSPDSEDAARDGRGKAEAAARAERSGGRRGRGPQGGQRGGQRGGERKGPPASQPAGGTMADALRKALDES